MSTAIDNFLKTREKYKTEMAQGNGMGKNQGFFKGSNEMDLCGSKGLGMIMGVFLNDSKDVPYRVIKDYRTFRINKETAQKYDIKNFELRLCDPDEYQVTDAEKEVIRKLIKKLESVEKNWDAWEGKIAKYKPTYSKTLTIQYMKVLQRLDQNMNPVTVDPGVKVLKSRSMAYYRAFDSLITSNNAATGGYEFLSDLLSRTAKERNIKYSIQVTRPQYYNFTITQVPAKTEITDADLNLAGDLDTEVIDVTKVDIETLNKWNKMLNDEYKAIVDGVNKGAVEAQPAPVVNPEPVVNETVPVTPSDTAESPVQAPAEEVDDPFI